MGRSRAAGSELYIVSTPKQHDMHAFYRLRSVLGIGKILALVILYEVQDIRRFPSGTGNAYLVLLGSRRKKHSKGKALTCLAHRDVSPTVKVEALAQTKRLSKQEHPLKNAGRTRFP